MTEPRIAILMCTFNGEAFLPQQLRSLSEQIHQNWHLYASDDGSNDATLTARDYLAAAARADSVAHDWWAYQIVSGSGGVVYYNPNPTVRYRQHRSNVVGANTGWRARYRRFKFMCAGRFAIWTTRNLGALHSVRHMLTSENAQLLNDVEKLRVGSVSSRLSTLWRSKIHRQTTMGNIGLTIAVILKRL